jgi:uncharacterized repeat protein (TIGR03803 family)
MPSKRALHISVAFVVVCGFFGTASPAFAASKEKVLFNFCSVENCRDGAGPRAGLISDSAGNWYGTAEYDGAYYNGTVFQLTRGANNTVTVTVLHSFAASFREGIYPLSSLVLDSAGNLYGTTEEGGNLNYCENGCGVVFELSPGTHGWHYKVLHRFSDGDGAIPEAGLTIDVSGNLYGTTSQGGGKGRIGTVFELTPNAGGKWTEKVLYSFCHDYTCTDGWFPESQLIFDTAGNLYGTTNGGSGTVFQLTPGANGRWVHKILHLFGEGKDGNQPVAGVTFDAAGNLYGTTYNGGGHERCHSQGCGTVFEMTPSANGKWTERVLHSFGSGTDGGAVVAGVVLDAAGNIYGTTEEGGNYASCEFGCGTVFELRPTADGNWSETILHSFDGQDGNYPFGSLMLDAIGNLYGTNCCGGDAGGVVFEIAP